MLSARPRPAVAGAFLSGTVLGALATGAALFVLGGLLSPVPETVRAGVVLAGLVALIARTAGAVRFPMPQNARQIPRTNFMRPPVIAAHWFGFELGTGVRTYLTTDAPYALAAIIVLAAPGGLWAGLVWTALGAAAFGIGRSWVVLTQLVTTRQSVEPPVGAVRIAGLMALIVAFGVATTRLV